MNKLGFIFLAILYILVSIFSFAGNIPENAQLIACGILIALVGIPHGAIDNVLFLKDNNIHPVKFYSGYLILMLVYLILWLLYPSLSLIIFLFVSAYHFGESQFSKYFRGKSFFRNSLYFIWGANILAGMILYNNLELQVIFASYSDLQALLYLFNSNIYLYLLALTSLYLLGIVIYSLQTKKIKPEDVFKELYILVLIHIAFAVLPLLPGFTLYFVVLHSTKVLIDEFNFLKSKSKSNTLTVTNFVTQLIPFTFISLIGGMVILLLINFGFLNISYVLVAIILISLITLPHSVVMYRFYNQ
ncbi:MAG: Brp/Blh family beta-carotene 15,15'-monooxygenase [Saprospiraceae bacterium]|jgi:Brp/Blh family beta-carotene 15,15'-monooxygenase